MGKPISGAIILWIVCLIMVWAMNLMGIPIHVGWREATGLWVLLVLSSFIYLGIKDIQS